MSDAMGSPIVRFGKGLAACFMVAGAPVSGYFLFQIFLVAQASTQWPTTIGEITRAEVEDDGFGHYIPAVAYTYTVEGDTYVGRRIRAADGQVDSRSAAEDAIRGLTTGQSVPVRFNPGDPSQSLLRAGAGFAEYALLAVPLVMLAGGVATFWWLWRTRG